VHGRGFLSSQLFNPRRKSENQVKRYGCDSNAPLRKSKAFPLARIAQILGEAALRSLCSGARTNRAYPAADVEPVREVLVPGQTGLVAPLFDTDKMAELALHVLADPGSWRPLGRAARALVEERYSLSTAVEELKNYFERMA
jgi:hypothetical protein